MATGAGVIAGYSLGIVVCVVIFALVLLLVLVITTPLTRTRARAGLHYSVNGSTRALPDDMTFDTPAPYLLKGSAQAKQEAHLNRVVSLFRRADIPCWLTCGSLLGAMRHGASIPWDDDNDMNVLLSDETRIRKLASENKDKMTLVEAGGGIKLCAKNWRHYPFVDIIFVDEREGRLDLAYPLKAGKPTYSKAKQWPRECFARSDVFPIRWVPYADGAFEVPIPAKAEELMVRLFGESAMKHAVAGNSWLWTHSSLMIVNRLGFVKRSAT